MKEITPDSTAPEVALRLEYLLGGEKVYFTTTFQGNHDLVLSRLAGVRICEIIEDYLKVSVPPRKNFKITGLRDADVVTNRHVPKGTAIIGPKLSGTLKDGVLQLDPIEISFYGVMKNVGGAE